ncbi:MAG: hypothetical protein H6731_01700 [Myxococcales bacterium]|nr:MAG: hypothetical protein H6731_01700 [Myxococcales bacterium]
MKIKYFFIVLSLYNFTTESWAGNLNSFPQHSGWKKLVVNQSSVHCSGPSDARFWLCESEQYTGFIDFEKPKKRGVPYLLYLYSAEQKIEPNLYIEKEIDSTGKISESYFYDYRDFLLFDFDEIMEHLSIYIADYILDIGLYLRLKEIIECYSESLISFKQSFKSINLIQIVFWNENTLFSEFRLCSARESEPRQEIKFLGKFSANERHDYDELVIKLARFG